MHTPLSSRAGLSVRAKSPSTRAKSLTFTNDDEFIHQIYVNGDNFSFDSDERAPGQNLTESFTQAGTFEVRCHIHPKMKLVVHVK